MTMTMAAAQPWTLRHAALGLSLLVAALGATVLGGWVLDLGALRQIVPGAATMRVNTSVGLLCVGIALAALSRNKVPTASRVGACAVAAAVFIIGVLTLAQDIIGHDLGIDDRLLNGATPNLGTSNPARMSPPTAFCFVLAGIALAFVATRSFRRLRAPIVAALGATLLLIAGIALAGHALEASLGIRSLNFARISNATSVGFAMLGVAVIALIRSERELTWSLDSLTTGGFAFGVLALLAIVSMSYEFTRALERDAGLVARSHEILKRVEALDNNLAIYSNSRRDFVLGGAETALQVGDAPRTRLRGDLEELRRLASDNPEHRARLDRLAPLMTRWIESAEFLVEVRRREGFTGVQQAIVAGQGAGLRDEIRTLIDALRTHEYAVLDRRQAQSVATSARTFLFLPLGVFVSLTVLALGLFALNAGRGESDRVEESRRETEALFRTIFELSADGVAMADADMNIVMANAAAERMFGYPRGGLVGTPARALIANVDDEVFERERDRLAIDARAMSWSVPWQATGVRKDGSQFPIEITRSSFSTQRGNFVFGIVRDVTGRKHAEEELARLAAIVRSSDDAIIGHDLAGRVTTWNEGAVKAFGYAEAEMIGRPVATVIPLDRLREGQRIHHRVRRGDAVDRFETVRVRKDGRLIDVSLTVSPIRDPDGRIVGASTIARDITEKRGIEQAT